MNGRPSPLLMVGAVAVTVALVVAIVVIRSGSGSSTASADDPPSDDPIGEPTIVGSGPCPDAPGSLDRGIVIRECGYTAVTTGEGNRALGTIGLVLQNSGAHDAAPARLGITFFGEDGRALYTTHLLVTTLRQGDTIGLGQTMEHPGFGQPISEIRIAGFVDSFGPDAPPQPDQPVTASDPTVTTDGLTIETSFDVESGYPDDVDAAFAYVLFRDPAGTLIGGHAGLVELAPDRAVPATVRDDGILDLGDDPEVEIYLDPLVVRTEGRGI